VLKQTSKKPIDNIKKNKIAYISSYPPRECGIATFTKNLVVATNKLKTLRKPIIVAMNEGETIYNYDKRVKCQIRRNAPQPDLLKPNSSRPSAVCRVVTPHRRQWMEGSA